MNKEDRVIHSIIRSLPKEDLEHIVFLLFSGKVKSIHDLMNLVEATEGVQFQNYCYADGSIVEKDVPVGIEIHNPGLRIPSKLYLAPDIKYGG